MNAAEREYCRERDLQKLSPEMIEAQRAIHQAYAATLPKMELPFQGYLTSTNPQPEPTAAQIIANCDRMKMMFAEFEYNVWRSALTEVAAMLDNFPQTDLDGKPYTLANAAALVRAMRDRKPCQT